MVHRSGKCTWYILRKLYQNLNLACCHFCQQEKVFLCAVLILKLEPSICSLSSIKGVITRSILKSTTRIV